MKDSLKISWLIIEVLALVSFPDNTFAGPKVFNVDHEFHP